ncbi:MAG: hypothetical protein G01um101433_1039 [Parcubacteria group bacterium Gr01-1014_33]|nr:MAG: hypothetical protein G01um101433_1039 [Parcubacteria group bacterium Gr01-1014_33]
MKTIPREESFIIIIVKKIMSSREHKVGSESNSMDQLRAERRQDLLKEEEKLMQELAPYMDKIQKWIAIKEELAGLDS